MGPAGPPGLRPKFSIADTPASCLEPKAENNDSGKYTEVIYDEPSVYFPEPSGQYSWRLSNWPWGFALNLEHPVQLKAQ